MMSGSLARQLVRGRLIRVLAIVVALLHLASSSGVAATGDALPVPAIVFPRDDGPHNALTEWWYYTGHLTAEDGAVYGFEQVTFKGRRGSLRGYASHVAITDVGRDAFVYDQGEMIENGEVSRPGEGFDLTIGDWSMRGANGVDALTAALPGYAYDLDLIAQKPAALHGGDGYVETAAGVVSAYYSRTRMAVSGALEVDGASLAVTGLAWMDHQWGDFIQFSEGGWDWFSLQLDDGADVMIYVLRDSADRPSLFTVTLVGPDGTTTDLGQRDVEVDAIATWTSPASGAVYPMGWNVRLLAEDLDVRLTPVREDQELDARKTTNVTYWEGAVEIEGSRGGEPVAGRGYVELTGYARARDGTVP